MENKSGGISFLGLLQLTFIILKLCNVIKWTWGLVLIPLWVGIGLTILVSILSLILALIGD